MASTTMIATPRHQAERRIGSSSSSSNASRSSSSGPGIGSRWWLTASTILREGGGLSRSALPTGLPGSVLYRPPEPPLRDRAGAFGSEGARGERSTPRRRRILYIDRDPQGGAMKAGTKVRLGAAIALAAIWSGAFVPTALSQEETTGSAQDEKVTFTVGQVKDEHTLHPLFLFSAPESARTSTEL